MKVFISWSGERSQGLAMALREWLPLVLHYVEPWLSQADIEAGKRWGVEVAKELDASAFGITCVTTENINSPWILFEAGALAKSMPEGRVVPLLLDVDFGDISGPLAQFQAKKIDKQGLSDVISSINKTETDPVAEGRLGELFEALWPKLEKSIEGIPENPNPKKPTRPQHEILEELVASVRSLDIRYREAMDEGMSAGRRKNHPGQWMMLDEMFHMISKDSRDPIHILLISSMFKEDFPWLYELGAEAYREMKAGHATEARDAQGKFLNAVELLRRGPFPMEEFGFDRRGLHMLMHQVDRFRLDFKQEEVERQRTKRRRVLPDKGG